VFHWRLHPTRKWNFKASPLRYASENITQYLTAVKLPGSSCLAVGKARLHAYRIFTGQLAETVPWSLSLSCRSELTRQGVTLPLDGYSYRRRLPVLQPLSIQRNYLCIPAALTNRHWSGLSPYTSSFEFSRDLCFW